MRLIAIAVSFTLISPFILAEGNNLRHISCKIYTYDGVKEIDREIAVDKVKKISSLFNKTVEDLNRENIESLLYELEKLKLLENFSKEEIKSLIFKPTYENMFCIVVGYGAICIQISLRNLPLWLLLLPISIIAPEIPFVIHMLLSAGIKFFRLATLSFLILANVASVSPFGEWNFTVWMTDVLMIGFIGIWINGLPGFTFIGVASYIKAPFP
ncbi:MAG: hypothetical protein FE047_02890 [Thermoplasmata archaeon]|nr:MAG: hypothetical protein FE047_02890 [Thermoplasmata archaeon]KAA0009409.1 MAG: hypothetical protein FE041_06080 [Thermoplasmata archaeon]